MSNLSDIRDRIRVIGKLQQITYTLQLVTGLKLHKLKRNLESINYFRNNLSQILTGVSQQILGMRALSDNMLFATPKGKKHLLLVVSSEMGFTGDFNTKLYQALQVLIQRLQEHGEEVQIVCIGKQIENLINRKIRLKNILRKWNLADGDAPDQEPATLSQPTKLSHVLSSKLQQWYQKKEFDMCTILYSHHISSLKREIQALMVVPCTFAAFKNYDGRHEQNLSSDHEVKIIDTSYFHLQDQQTEDLTKYNYYYEPDVDFMVSYLTANHLKDWLQLSILDSGIAEQTARLFAMDRASNNAKDIIKSNKLLYNKVRQQRVTRELIEIISAVELMHAQEEFK